MMITFGSGKEVFLAAVVGTMAALILLLVSAVFDDPMMGIIGIFATLGIPLFTAGYFHGRNHPKELEPPT